LPDCWRALFLAIAGAIPRDPEIFADAVHATDGGVRSHNPVPTPPASKKIRAGVRLARERTQKGFGWTHPAPFAKSRALGGSRRGNPGA
jgi:hypothetical protein